MKLPSVHFLLHHAGRAFLRFPLTLISAAIGVAVAIFLVENENYVEEYLPYVNVLLCAGLGVPLFFCVTIFCDHFNVNGSKRWLYYGAATIALVLLYFTFPGYESTLNTSVPYIRYVIYNATIHLVASFVPFLRSKQLNGFWNYNKILFIRIWASALYSGVLYIGLILAVAAVDVLFDVDVDEKLYFEIFIFILGIFNTWFFVSGIPERFDDLEGITEYPKGLKIFVQYVLLSLLLLYLVILYSYTGKIIFQWDWPKGMVSYLIICVSVLGILTLLLIYPYEKLAGNEWIKKFARVYYFILFPLVIVMFIAIYMRIGDYGITVSRYAVFMLGVWLTLVCLYFSIGKTNIKFIPVSLAIMLLLVSFGPWGIFSVSERSQVSRLRNIFEKDNILVNGKIKNETQWLKDSTKTFYSTAENKNENILSDSLHNEVMSIMNYLDKNHGFGSIKSWYEQDLDTKLRAVNKSKTERWTQLSEDNIYIRSAGLKDEYKYSHSNYAYASFEADENKTVISLSGYDYLINFRHYDYRETQLTIESFTINNEPYVFNYTGREPYILSVVGRGDTLSLNLQTAIDTLIQRYGNEADATIPDTEMQLMATGKRVDAKVQIQSLRIQSENDTLSLQQIDGMLFLRVKK